MPLCGLPANSLKSREPEFVDFFEGRFELLPIVIILGKGQHILASLFGQFGGQNQEVGSDSIQRGTEIFLGQAEPFEPMDQIVSQKQHLKKGHVGHPVFRGDFA